MFKLLRALSAGLALAAAAQVQAVTIDFEGFGPGTLITNQYAGLGVNFSGASISNYTCCGTPTATLVTATDGGGSGRTGILNIIFSGGASGVSFGYNNYGSLLGGYFQAFDSSNTLIETQGYTVASFSALELISFASSGIASITITSPSVPSWLVAIDDLTFNVPEPGSLALLGLALLGLGGTRRRARS